MAAARTPSLRSKGIPRPATALEKVLGIVAIAAVPAARCVRLPTARGATDATEIMNLAARCGAVGSLTRLQSLLKEPEYNCAMIKLT